jgi:hypothetical protein
VERDIFDRELRTEVKSALSLLFRRTFLMEERLVGRRSFTVAGVAVDDFGAFSGVAGLDMDSKTRWNFRFFDSTA